MRTSAQAFAKRMQCKTAKSFPIFTEPPHNASSLAELTPAIISMRRSDIPFGINGGSNWEKRSKKHGIQVSFKPFLCVNIFSPADLDDCNLIWLLGIPLHQFDDGTEFPLAHIKKKATALTIKLQWWQGKKFPSAMHRIPSTTPFFWLRNRLM